MTARWIVDRRTEHVCTALEIIEPSAPEERRLVCCVESSDGKQVTADDRKRAALIACAPELLDEFQRALQALLIYARYVAALPEKHAEALREDLSAATILYPLSLEQQARIEEIIGRAEGSP